MQVSDEDEIQLQGLVKNIFPAPTPSWLKYFFISFTLLQFRKRAWKCINLIYKICWYWKQAKDDLQVKLK